MQQRGDLNVAGAGGYVFNVGCESAPDAISQNKAQNDNSDASKITPFYSADDEGGQVNRFLKDYRLSSAKRLYRWNKNNG